MPIDIGDAVLTFLGDTTQLDAAFAKVEAQAPAAMGSVVTATQGATTAAAGLGAEIAAVGAEAPAAMAPAVAAMEGMTAAVAGLETEMAVGMSGAVKLGEVVNLAGETSRESLYQARGEAGLLGEAFDIHLPRHVRSFLAELPGVGEALSSAFTATAVFFLIDALIKGTEKLSEWVAETFIFTEAERNLNNVLLESNSAIAKYAEEVEKLQKQYELIGAKGSQRPQIEFQFAAKDEQDVAAKIRDISNDIFALNRGLRDTSEIIPVVNGLIRQLNPNDNEKTLLKKFLPDDAEKDQVIGALAALHDQLLAQDKVFQQKEANIERQFDVDRTSEAEAAAKKREALEEKVAKAIGAARAALSKELEKQNEGEEKIDDFRLKKELKGEEDAAKEKLRLLRQQEDAAIAVIDGEIKAEQDKDEKKADLLKIQYDKGLITGQQYLAQLKALYASEVQALTQMLNQKEQLVILEAQNEAAQRGRILTVDEAKELKAFIDLENKKRQIADEFTNKFLKAEDQVTTKLAKTYNTLGGLLDAYSKKLRAAHNELTGFGQAADAVLNGLSQAFGTAIEQWVTGQATFGQALERALQQYLAQVAGKAAIDALYFLAWGIADSFWNPARAGVDFAAAGEFAAIAGIAGGAAAAMGKQGGASSSGSSSGSGSSGSTIGSASQPAQNPVQTVNAQHFAAGGLVSAPTLALIGEGRNREAVLPLDDHRAIDAIATAIGDRIHAQGGSGWHGDIVIQGMVSSDTARKFIKRVSSDIGKGKMRLNASNARRNIKFG